MKEITVTRAQWLELVPIVVGGRGMERKLGLPVELKNGDVAIEIGEAETKITLTDG